MRERITLRALHEALGRLLQDGVPPEAEIWIRNPECVDGDPLRDMHGGAENAGACWHMPGDQNGVESTEAPVKPGDRFILLSGGW